MTSILLNPRAGTAPPHATRDRTIAIGAWVAIAAFAFDLIGAMLTLVEYLNLQAIAGIVVAQSLLLVAVLAEIAAATALGVALVGDPARRGERLRIGIGLYAGYAAGCCIAASVFAGVFDAHSLPGNLTGTEVAQAVASAIAAGAYGLAASAFRTSGESTPAREARLAVAAFVLLASTIASLVADILGLTAGASLQALGETSGSEALTLVSDLCQGIAAVVLAVAFLRSAGALAGRAGGASGWRPRRDRIVAVAGAVLTLGTLFTAIGAIVAAADDTLFAGESLDRAGAWITAVGELTLVVAVGFVTAGCALSGFRGRLGSRAPTTPRPTAPESAPR